MAQNLHNFSIQDIDGNQINLDKFKDNIYFQTCADFCERWDQKSFDPEYRNKDLDFFKPMIKEIFKRPPYKEEFIKKSEVLGLPKI